MKRHPTDMLSLLPGLLFIAIAVVALAGGLTVDLLSADWVWPSVLIALGVLVLASAGLGRRDRTGAPGEGETGQVHADEGEEAETGGLEEPSDEVSTDHVR